RNPKLLRRTRAPAPTARARRSSARRFAAVELWAPRHPRLTPVRTTLDHHNKPAPHAHLEPARAGLAVRANHGLARDCFRVRSGFGARERSADGGVFQIHPARPAPHARIRPRTIVHGT